MTKHIDVVSGKTEDGGSFLRVGSFLLQRGFVRRMDGVYWPCWQFVVGLRCDDGVGPQRFCIRVEGRKREGDDWRVTSEDE
jgi:hypothetical protein